MTDPRRATFERFVTPDRVAPSDRDRQLLAAGTPHRVPFDGDALAAWTFGGPGPRVLLVHGWSSRGSHLGALVAPLVAAGLGVVAFDGPGHGDSGGRFATVVHQGRAVGAVAAALGPFDGVVAHSMGSPASLIAFAGGLRVRASVHLAGPVSVEPFLAGFSAHHGLDAGATADLRARVEAFAGVALRDLELDALRDGLRHPALLLHDPDDAEVPFRASRALHAAWPGAELVPTPGVGHRRILVAPDVVARVAGWLGQRLAAPAAA